MRRGPVLQLYWIALTAVLPAPAYAQAVGRFADAPEQRPREYWATGGARRLHARAVEYERRGDVPRALVAYTDALTLDAGYGPAWLGLGRLRAAMRDDGEAERVLSAAVRIPEVAPEALFQRALLRQRHGRTAQALADLELSVAGRPSIEHIRVLSTWYVQLRAWPAALTTWRRLAAVLAADSDPALLEEVQLQLQALQLLAAESDPVLAGQTSKDWVRRALASIARRSALSAP